MRGGRDRLNMRHFCFASMQGHHPIALHGAPTLRTWTTQSKMITGSVSKQSCEVVPRGVFCSHVVLVLFHILTVSYNRPCIFSNTTIVSPEIYRQCTCPKETFSNAVP